MNKAKLISQWRTFLTRKTKQHIPAIYRVIRGQLKYYAETRDLNFPIAPMYDVLRNLYVDTGRLWAYQSYVNVNNEARVGNKAAPLGLNQEFINAILSYFNARLLEKVSDINLTTREWVELQITKGIEDGLSLDQVIRNIVGNTDMPRYRAERISRTENMFAASNAEEIGVAKTGLETVKVWLSVNDNRTRHDHILVDDQERPADEPFNVGNYRMMRPGDTTTQNVMGQVAPAKEVVNCRCCLGRKVLRDADGLPLRRQRLAVL